MCRATKLVVTTSVAGWKHGQKLSNGVIIIWFNKIFNELSSFEQLWWTSLVFDNWNNQRCNCNTSFFFFFLVGMRTLGNRDGGWSLKSKSNRRNWLLKFLCVYILYCIHTKKLVNNENVNPIFKKKKILLWNYQFITPNTR